MRRITVLALLGIAAALHAQTLNLWPGVAPGSEHWTQTEHTYTNTPIGTVVINVVTPTLTAYVPDPDKATGTGVIVAPGGAFIALAIDLEGDRVARWLRERGIAAFVLKYRTIEKRGEGFPKDMDAAGQYGIADGMQAIQVVRQHATAWHVSPDRIGILGFSAGGMVASATVLQSDAAARPNFAAMIYGAPFGAMPPIPPKLPPLFLAWAKDDPLVLNDLRRFYDALRAAGNKPEVQVYDAGGHGFGMKRQGTESDRWIEDFYRWLGRIGMTRRSTSTSSSGPSLRSGRRVSGT